MSKPIAIHAVLVGINEWKHPDQIKSLRGCHNEVALIKETLGRLFPPEAIRTTTLLDSAATVEGIVKAFRKSLIRPAEAWHREHPNSPKKITGVFVPLQRTRYASERTSRQQVQRTR